MRWAAAAMTNQMMVSFYWKIDARIQSGCHHSGCKKRVDASTLPSSLWLSFYPFNQTLKNSKVAAMMSPELAR